MRCGCFIRDTTTKNGKPHREQRSWWHTINVGDTSSAELLAEGYYVCQGLIQSSVLAVEEPYMGGVSASLEVTFACNTCGWNFYPHLPTNGRSLDEFLTDVLAREDDGPLIASAVAIEKSNRERRAVMIENMREKKRLAQDTNKKV